MSQRWKQRGLRALGVLLAAGMAAGTALADGQMYEAYRVEGSVSLHYELLHEVDSAQSAGEAVREQVRSLTGAQKTDPADVDQTTLFAEAAASQAARTRVEGGEIHVSAQTVEGLAEQVLAARQEVEDALKSGGVVPNRTIFNTLIFETDAAALTVVLHPDILDTAVDKIRVERTAEPAFAVTIKPADLRADLRPEGGEARILTLSIRERGDAYEPGTAVRIPAVELEVPEGQLSAPVTLSLYPGSAEPSELTVLGEGGSTPASRYNAATRTLDARVNCDDVYTFGRGNVRFPDLAEKNEKMRLAVEALTRVNVVHGYSDNTFRPDNPVTRAQFVAFVMRTLGRVNNSLKTPFGDVTESNGCYHEIASAYYYGVIKGYDAEHFRGELPISKTQIYAIVGRILQSEMGYWTPENPEGYLSREFSDTVPAWAQGDVALSTREGLVIRQENGKFEGGQTVNRGDVALIIYGLYQRLS